MKSVVALLLALSCALGAFAQERDRDKGADSNRIAIKLAIDPGARRIAKRAKLTTVAAIKALKRPKSLADDISTPAYQRKRIAPFETTRWKVDLTLTEVSLHKDGDIYLVATDGGGSRMVLECPDPEEAATSPLHREISRARALVGAKLRPTSAKKSLKVRATVVALGFWGKAKAGDNGARLQPILSISLR